MIGSTLYGSKLRQVGTLCYKPLPNASVLGSKEYLEIKSLGPKTLKSSIGKRGLIAAANKGAFPVWIKAIKENDREGLEKYISVFKKLYPKDLVDFLNTPQWMEKGRSYSCRPLHVAFYNDNLEMAKLLVDNGGRLDREIQAANKIDEIASLDRLIRIARSNTDEKKKGGELKQPELVRWAIGFLVNQGVSTARLALGDVRFLKAKKIINNKLKTMAEEINIASKSIAVLTRNLVGGRVYHIEAWAILPLFTNAIINEDEKTLGIYLETFKKVVGSQNVKVFVNAHFKLHKAENDGARILHTAVHNGFTGIVRQLLDCGAQVDLSASINDPRAPLSILVDNVEELVRSGPVNSEYKKILNASDEIFELLLKKSDRSVFGKLDKSGVLNRLINLSQSGCYEGTEGEQLKQDLLLKFVIQRLLKKGLDSSGLALKDIDFLREKNLVGPEMCFVAEEVPEMAEFLNQKTEEELNKSGLKRATFPVWEKAISCGDENTVKRYVDGLKEVCREKITAFLEMPIAGNAPLSITVNNHNRKILITLLANGVSLQSCLRGQGGCPLERSLELFSDYLCAEFYKDESDSANKALKDVVYVIKLLLNKAARTDGFKDKLERLFDCFVRKLEGNAEFWMENLDKRTTVKEVFISFAEKVSFCDKKTYEFIKNMNNEIRRKSKKRSTDVSWGALTKRVQELNSARNKLTPEQEKQIAAEKRGYEIALKADQDKASKQRQEKIHAEKEKRAAQLRVKKIQGIANREAGEAEERAIKALKSCKTKKRLRDELQVRKEEQMKDCRRWTELTIKGDSVIELNPCIKEMLTLFGMEYQEEIKGRFSLTIDRIDFYGSRIYKPLLGIKPDLTTDLDMRVVLKHNNGLAIGSDVLGELAESLKEKMLSYEYSQTTTHNAPHNITLTFASGDGRQVDVILCTELYRQGLTYLYQGQPELRCFGGDSRFSTYISMYDGETATMDYYLSNRSAIDSLGKYINALIKASNNERLKLMEVMTVYLKGLLGEALDFSGEIEKLEISIADKESDRTPESFQSMFRSLRELRCRQHRIPEIVEKIKELDRLLGIASQSEKVSAEKVSAEKVSESYT
ncbi:hypothetical protein OAJ27_01250 [bacterium]|nr:hypothetical protein [bacterium]